MNGCRVGSLFTGTGALDLAVMDVFDAGVVWHSQYEPPDKNGKEDKNQYAAKILERHWPSTPNLGDITKVDWQDVLDEHGPIDILTGGFPCFPAGTLINTSAGLTPIEEVKEGDLVLTHRRRWKPVTQTMSRRADHRISIKAMGTPTINTTDEHPFYARRAADGSPEWIRASDLQPGMYLAQPLDDEASEEPSEEDLAVAYLIGRWLGDGWTVTYKRNSKIPQGQRGSRVTSVARRVHWCCAPKETVQLEAAFNAAGINPTRSDARTVVKYVMQSAKWADVLDQYGKYAYGKRIPEATHRMSRATQAAILRGWLDSDGSTKSDGSIAGVTVSRALALGMARIARHVHGKAVSVHETRARQRSRIEGRLVNNRASWEVRISPGPSKRGYVDAGFAWVPVRSVTRAEADQDVFNIGVLGDESYIAESVAVHNCQDVSSAGRRVGLAPDSRSGLWAHMAHAAHVLRPRLVVIENVEGLLSASADRGLGLDAEALEEEAQAGRVLRALGAVLGDLASLGFDAEWCRMGASEVGAPHGRKRVFVYAWPADGQRWPDAVQDAHIELGDQRGLATPRQTEGGWTRTDPGRRGRAPAADTGRQGLEIRRIEPDGPELPATERGRREPSTDTHSIEPERRGVAGVLGSQAAAQPLEGDQRERAGHAAGDSREATADADGRGSDRHQERDGEQVEPGLAASSRMDPVGRGVQREAHADTSSVGRGEGRSKPTRQQGRPHATECGGATPADADRGGWREDVLNLRPGQPDLDWGDYGPAIRRWERILGRPAPWPTDALGRLSPVFTEWLMGLPDGWVTNTPGLPRAAMLRALGNGVVRLQAATAIRHLHERAQADPAAV
ncbi:DNA cytosine methyltransferase [Streptomyces syringium]|uniref:DNA cytosine methyltransferase n=1 Tax=Streptomyces syringium TaxID=76729 RepID=UPI003451B722